MQFVFDDEGLEVLIKSKDDKAEESENKFVGGQNRWSYDAFTNWEFWWKKFPVLVYFKVCSINTSCGLWHHHCNTSCTTLIQNSEWICMGTQNVKAGSAAWLKAAMTMMAATAAPQLTCSIMKLTCTCTTHRHLGCLLAFQSMCTCAQLTAHSIPVSELPSVFLNYRACNRFSAGA